MTKTAAVAVFQVMAKTAGSSAPYVKRLPGIIAKHGGGDFGVPHDLKRSPLCIIGYLG